MHDKLTRMSRLQNYRAKVHLMQQTERRIGIYRAILHQDFIFPLFLKNEVHFYLSIQEETVSLS